MHHLKETVLRMMTRNLALKDEELISSKESKNLLIVPLPCMMLVPRAAIKQLDHHKREPNRAKSGTELGVYIQKISMMCKRKI